MAKSDKKYRVGKSKIQGDGAFAKQTLNPGDYIGKVHTINKLYEDYDFTELGKKHNHSEDPNVQNVLIGNERHLVAIKPIKKGEELTSDYRLQPDLEQPDQDFDKAKNGKKTKTGGWLDAYDAPQAQNGIEGTMGGLTDKGFNFNPAWGGAWQNGGMLQPPMAGAVQTVPMYQMGGSLPGATGMMYARTQGAAPSEGPYAKKTLPSAQKGLSVEQKVNKSLGNPMGKAARFANEIQPGEDFDNARHYMAGALTNKAIQDKTGNIPIVSDILGWVGSNVSGIGHELATMYENRNYDKRPWSNKIRESFEDIVNNAVGATAGSIYNNPKQIEDLFFDLSKRNLLPDGIVDPKGLNLYLKKTKEDKGRFGKYINGGEMQFYQAGLDFNPKTISEDGSIIQKAQKGTSLLEEMRKKDEERRRNFSQSQGAASSTSVKKPVVDKVLAEGVDRKKGESFEAAYARKKKELDAKRKADDERRRRNTEAYNKRIVQERQAKINQANENPLNQGFGFLNSSNWTRENMANTAIADKMRFFPNDATGLGSIIDEYVNPLYMIGSIADNLGSAPLRAKETNSALPYITSVGLPLLLGRGLGSGSINPLGKNFWTKTVPNNEFTNSLFLGIPKVAGASGQWAKELVEGSLAAGKIKAPSFPTVVRVEREGFDPTKVAYNPALTEEQNKLTGSWVQSAQTPAELGQVKAYLTGMEVKEGDKPFQILAANKPWSQVQKLRGKGLPEPGKTMSFGAGEYGTPYQAYLAGKMSLRDAVLLENYYNQQARILKSPNLTRAAEEMVSRVRGVPELYNPLEIANPELASAMRRSPLATGSTNVILNQLGNLENRIGTYISNQIGQGATAFTKGILPNQLPSTSLNLNEQPPSRVAQNKPSTIRNITSPTLFIRTQKNGGDVKQLSKGGVSVNRADEYPLEKLDNLLNFTNYNKPKAKNGWLDKYA